MTGLEEVPRNSIDLIIVDPPYFKTVNQSWDYEWKTKDEYISWCRKWLDEIERVSKINASFYLFGYFRTLAYQIPEIENRNFDVRQQIIVDKGMQAVSGRATKNYQMFPKTTEEIIFARHRARPSVREFLKKRKEEVGVSADDIHRHLGLSTKGGGVWSIYTGDNVMGKLPPKNRWEQLSEILEFDIPYSEIGHTFNQEMGISNVWDDIDFYSEDRDHPTQKPLELIERLIRTSSNEGDNILDPMMGSGTTAIAAQNLDRNYLGFEIDDEYYEIARNRLE